MNWVTWQNVGVDRMACAWLIRKYIDTNASFSFIPEGSSSLEPLAFDIPGAHLGHHQGHSSFHTVTLEYKLEDAVLKRIAQIVDEADIVSEISLEAAAFGLDLICRGIRRSSATDLMALEHGALIFEALYAELLFEGDL
jgi:hypothetical protein